MSMLYEKSRQKKNLEANYRKFWVMTKVNLPFIFAVLLIQKNWHLPLGARGIDEALYKRQEFIDKLNSWDQDFFRSKRFYSFFPAIREILNLDLADDHKRKVLDVLLAESPKRSFMRTMLNLMGEFSFSGMWSDCLVDYVITGFINPPFEKMDKDIPPKSIKENIDLLNKVAPKTNESGRVKNWTILADTILGEPDDYMSFPELSDYERKRTQRLKTNFNRLQKSPFYVVLTADYKKRLLKLFG